jgi:radical SAM superfamily enzyme YgiQ (UPF0313 family)
MYKNTRFRIRKVEDIKEDLLAARQYYGEYIESLFFPDGNTIYMKTAQLAEIIAYARSLFPHLQRITVYGSARFVNLKKPEELLQLRQAGLSRIHMGMESGDDIVLERVRKGTTPAEIIEAGKKLKDAGIEVSEYYLVGIGGKDRTVEHAVNSARVLSAISPDFIRIRTFGPDRNTPIEQDIASGAFQMLTPHEALKEIRLLIENLDCGGSNILSDHISNYSNINGRLPEDKRLMLKQIDRSLNIDETRFRPPRSSVI